MPADVIRSLCSTEMAEWNSRKVGYGAALAEYQKCNATRHSTFLLAIRDGRVSILDKPEFYSRQELDAGSDPYIYAARLYRDFIQGVVETHCRDIDTIMALDTDDRGLSSETAPIFVISKLCGRNSVLLPHYEFIMFEFHEADKDEIPYSDKALSAIFAGSTTGKYFDENDVRQLSFPRLRAAAFFKDHPLVDFRLTNIVQCTPGAEKLLREMGFGGAKCSWKEQFQNKFIISMDGNAGSCSRVTMALKSNCVLLKYDSDHIMHYYHHLVPWRHFVPISKDSDVGSVLEMEPKCPLVFDYIANEGKAFFQGYLVRHQIVNYMAVLLQMYVNSFDRSSVPVPNPTMRLPSWANPQVNTAGAQPMISRLDVIAAYRTVLGREPENDQVIQDQIAAADSVEQLYRNFIESEEFREVFLSTLAPSDLPNPHKPLVWPPIHVESKVSDATQLATIFSRVNRAWTRYGEQEPYFSVCTDPELRGTDIGEQAIGFYASGQGDAHYLTSFAARSGVELAGRSCFELGCGVGRVTRWLAPLFRRVYAADISPGHLAITQRVLAEAGIENVSLTQLDSLEDLRQIVNFDVFFSVIALQHNPPPVIAYILMQVLTNLNLGGLAFFQLPTYALDYEFNVDNYLNAPTEGEPEMEMHVLPQRDVMRIVHTTGCRLLELREDGYTGDRTHISNTFFLQKISDSSAKVGSAK